MNRVFGSVLFALIISAAPSFGRCSCEGPLSAEDNYKQQIAEAARRVPSEKDRQLARDFYGQKMLVDAATYYQSASEKATGELNAAKSGKSSAAELEQTALHSAAVHREVATFFAQKGDAALAAPAWEAAINDVLTSQTAGTTSATAKDFSSDYGTVARLYLQAGDNSRAAEMFRLQAESLSKTHGRYDAGVKYALSEYSRLSRRTASNKLSHL